MYEKATEGRWQEGYLVFFRLDSIMLVNGGHVMKTFNRSYSESKGDFNGIAEFLIKENTYLREYSTWSLPRFVDWKYGLYKSRTAIAGFWGKNARLWFDGFDKLVGIAISEDGGTGFVIITSCGYRFMFEEMLCWVLHNWSGRGDRHHVEIAEKQEYECRILERMGFKSESTFYTRYFDLTGSLPERYPLEEGYEIIDMQMNPEYGC